MPPGVSKGGVLYHFPTKEALVAALLEELTSSFDADQTDAHNADPIALGAWTPAYVTASSAPPQDEAAEVASVALLAALGTTHHCSNPFKPAMQARSGASTMGCPGVDAHVVRLAADGLWAADLFNLAPPDPAVRVRIHARLAELASASVGQ